MGLEDSLKKVCKTRAVVKKKALEDFAHGCGVRLEDFNGVYATPASGSGMPGLAGELCKVAASGGHGGQDRGAGQTMDLS